MNFLELVTKRCSIRRFASTPVEIEKIEYILEAARLSPVGCKFSALDVCCGSAGRGKAKVTRLLFA